MVITRASARKIPQRSPRRQHWLAQITRVLQGIEHQDYRAELFLRQCVAAYIEAPTQQCGSEVVGACAVVPLDEDRTGNQRLPRFVAPEDSGLRQAQPSWPTSLPNPRLTIACICLSLSYPLRADSKDRDDALAARQHRLR